jgi:hypothetical protein
MPVIQNPRVGESFKNDDIKCSICNELNSYLYHLSYHYNVSEEINFNDPSNILICKGCLTDFIEEIDSEIIKDIKDANREE